MSKDLYKAQAERLAEHLTTKHGVKLKPSSLLEAIASIHGARDWNTLAATPATVTAPSVAPEIISNSDAELSPAEQLLRTALNSGAMSFRFTSPSARSHETQGKLTYDYKGIRSHVAMTEERTKEFRDLLLGLAGMSLETVPEMLWNHSNFSYQDISGRVRRLQTRSDEEFEVEWDRGTSFTRRVESLETVAPLVKHFENPQAYGMYLVASVNSASSAMVTQALASRAPSRSYVETHDFENDSDSHWQRGDIDVAMGELRTPEGLRGLDGFLDAGCLALTRVHARGVDGAIKRAKQVGLTDSHLRQHLRGVLALESLRTACTHCAGKGCTTCKKSGIGGIVHLYEYVLLDKAKDYDVLGDNDRPRPTLKQQAQELVAQGRVTLEEAQRVFGPDF